MATRLKRNTTYAVITSPRGLAPQFEKRCSSSFKLMGCPTRYPKKSQIGDKYRDPAVQFPRSQQHSKRMRRWVGIKGSIRNWRRDLKCPSARRLRMVREDAGAPNKGATCAWIAGDEAVGIPYNVLALSTTGLSRAP
ncbi:uncharacterized protein TNCV_1762411 [Trichonephila clavipes]|nr:uncharacterized protein TNCV_1762411 [Trichonephila clavipes]